MRRAWRVPWRAPVARAAKLTALAAGAAALVACASTPSGATVAADVKAAREEQAPDKLFERGKAFAAVRDYTRAEQYLSAALDAGAPADKVLPVLLRVCVEENRYRAALLYAEPQLKEHPTDYHLRFVVASLYAGIGKSDVALDHLQQIAKVKPDHAEAQYAMAVLLRDEQRDPVRADKHFREYLRLDPSGRHASEARASLLQDAAAPTPSAVAPAAPPPDPAPEGTAGPTWKTIP